MNAKLQAALTALALVVLLVGGIVLYRIVDAQPVVPVPSVAPAVEVEQPSEPEAEPIKAPDFTVYDEASRPITFSSMEGKPTIINFWATWCFYCQLEMPSFEALYQEYGEDINFMMIDVTDGNKETQEKAMDFVQRGGYTFPVYYDLELDAAATYGASSLPSTVVIDADGNIYGAVAGVIPEDTLRNVITALLPAEDAAA